MRQRYIQSFNTAENVQAAIDNKELGKPYVAFIHDEQYIDWNTKDIDYTNMPLTFEIISGGTIYWKVDGPQNIKPLTITYKKNDEEWVSITSTTGGTPIEVEAGDNILFLGDNDAYGNALGRKNSFSGSTGTKFEIEGNIMSLIDSENFATTTTFGSAAFMHLFKDCIGLTSAENLILPVTALTRYCYSYMFAGCTSLTAVPELPATTLEMSCYSHMFQGCTSLTTAPALPATTLETSCYYGMFDGCTSLTTAPELPATTLAESCYVEMFKRCTSLTSAPALPAMTLAINCYNGMFIRCTKLNYIKCLATDISAYNCTSNWVYNVSSTGTFVKNSNMSSWPTGNNGIPAGWTVIDATE